MATNGSDLFRYLFVLIVFCDLIELFSSITTIRPNDTESIQVTLGDANYTSIIDNKWYLVAGWQEPITKWPMELKLSSFQYYFKENSNNSALTITMNIEKISNELDMYYIFSVNNKKF